MPNDWDLKTLTIEDAPCRRCRAARRREQEAYARGVRDEHARWEALREQEAVLSASQPFSRMREAMRAQMRRDRDCFRALCLLAATGLTILFALLVGGYR